MNRADLVSEVDWERRWAPYDPPTYQAVLNQLRPSDVILEIGAGDLRLARQMAQISRRVYAIEIQPALITGGILSQPETLPENLFPVIGDACLFPFPGEITTAVLLMRHCTHFQCYAEKLKAAGCQRLITNARWRMNVETIFLQDPRPAHNNIEIGWYACWCGATGFIPGPVEQITPDVEATVHEVADCPQCRDGFRRSVA